MQIIRIIWVYFVHFLQGHSFFLHISKPQNRRFGRGVKSFLHYYIYPRFFRVFWCKNKKINAINILIIFFKSLEVFNQTSSFPPRSPRASNRGVFVIYIIAICVRYVKIHNIDIFGENLLLKNASRCGNIYCKLKALLISSKEVSRCPS